MTAAELVLGLENAEWRAFTLGLYRGARRWVPSREDFVEALESGRVDADEVVARIEAARRYAELVQQIAGAYADLGFMKVTPKTGSRSRQAPQATTPPRLEVVR